MRANIAEKGVRFFIGRVLNGEEHMTDDGTLLLEYSREGSEQAFAEIVARHLPSVDILRDILKGWQEASPGLSRRRDYPGLFGLNPLNPEGGWISPLRTPPSWITLSATLGRVSRIQRSKRWLGGRCTQGVAAGLTTGCTFGASRQ